MRNWEYSCHTVIRATVTGPESGSLDIVISPSVGTVDGKVADERLEAVAGAQVVLVPEGSRKRPELFRNVTADKDGRFSIEKVAPGEYKLFAWEGLESYGYFDPELLRQSNSQGISLHVGELASRQTFDLKVIQAR